MTETTLLMSDLQFVENTAHIDVLNNKCRELFGKDDDLLLIRVYRNAEQFNDKNMLGLIYKPGHAGYYGDCGEVIWKYLRSVDPYVIEGDESMVCDEPV